jgi:LuxR family maltose regulon positive regulatory protein
MRGDPPFSPLRLLARNELLDISPKDLVFSLEETRVFLDQELSFALPLRLVRQLHQRLEGWPAGLRLASRVLTRLADEQEIEVMIASFAGHHWAIRGYFLSEVFHILPEELRAFLLHTSVLPRLNAALCDALLGRNDSANVIEALRSGDFFLAPLDETGEWMRYQGLFAEIMQQEARRLLGDERVNQLAIQASLWYEEHALLSDAIETALNATAYERAASLIARFIAMKEQNSLSVFFEPYSLKRWLERLPEAELERRPDFCLYYGMILLFTLVERSRIQTGRERIYHLLQLAEQQWRDANATAKLAQVFSFRALLARQEGRMLQALTWARQALAWLPEEDLTWRTIALTVVGTGEVVSGTLERAREAFLEARQLNRRLGNTMYERATRGMLSGMFVEEGALRYAAEQFRQMLAEARAQEDHDDIAHTQLGLARILYEWNQLAEAEQSAREGEALGEQLQEEEFLYMAALRLARIEQARGQSEQARERLSAWLARGPVPQAPQGYQFYREVQAELARLQLADGNRAAVERWASGLEQRAEILPPYQRQREQLMLARLRLAQGELTEAQGLLEELAASARQTGHQVFLLSTQIVLAQVYARQGEQAKARAQLRDVLAGAHSEGYIRLFLDEGAPVSELLRDLLPHLREGALLAYVRDLVNAAGETRLLPGEEKATGLVALPEALSPQELRVLRLLVAGNSNAEIASELVVSVNTVRSHVQNLYRKLDVNSRVQASSVARQLGLLS